MLETPLLILFNNGLKRFNFVLTYGYKFPWISSAGSGLFDIFIFYIIFYIFYIYVFILIEKLYIIN